jgi:hypothetical protein
MKPWSLWWRHINSSATEFREGLKEVLPDDINDTLAL